MKSIYSHILGCLRLCSNSNLKAVICTVVMLSLFTPMSFAAGANNGTPVMDVIKQESTGYLNGAHANYTVSAERTDGSLLVRINGADYYVTPVESERTVLKNLISIGAAALQETTADKALFTVNTESGVKYYSYNVDSIPQSSYTMTEVSSPVGMNVITTKVYDKETQTVTEKYYQLDLRNKAYGNGDKSMAVSVKLPNNPVNMTVSYNSGKDKANVDTTSMTRLYDKVTSYLDGEHETYSLTLLGEGETNPEGSILVDVAGKTYYYTPSKDADSIFLGSLSGYGANALVETDDPSKAVYEIDGKYYAIDPSLLKQSSFELKKVGEYRPGVITKYDYTLGTGGVDGVQNKTYYELVLKDDMGGSKGKGDRVLHYSFDALSGSAGFDVHYNSGKSKADIDTLFLDRLYSRVTSYLNGAHERYSLTLLPDGESNPEGSILVSVGGKMYYYTPSKEADSLFLGALAGYGSNALVETTDASKAVYEIDGKYYAIDTSKLMQSSYTLRKVDEYKPGVVTKYDYVLGNNGVEGVENKTYYELVLKKDFGNLDGDSVAYYRWTTDEEGNRTFEDINGRRIVTEATAEDADFAVHYNASELVTERIDYYNVAGHIDVLSGFFKGLGLDATGSQIGGAIRNYATSDGIESTIGSITGTFVDSDQS